MCGGGWHLVAAKKWAEQSYEREKLQAKCLPSCHQQLWPLIGGPNLGLTITERGLLLADRFPGQGLPQAEGHSTAHAAKFEKRKLSAGSDRVSDLGAPARIAICRRNALEAWRRRLCVLVSRPRHQRNPESECMNERPGNDTKWRRCLSCKSNECNEARRALTSCAPWAEHDCSTKEKSKPQQGQDVLNPPTSLCCQQGSWTPPGGASGRESRHAYLPPQWSWWRPRTGKELQSE